MHKERKSVSKYTDNIIYQHAATTAVIEFKTHR